MRDANLLSVRVTTDDKKGSDERREGINETRQGAGMVHGTTTWLRSNLLKFRRPLVPATYYPLAEKPL